MQRKVGASVAVLTILAIGVVWLDPTQTILGRLGGDPFCQGRPMRYWAQQLSGTPAESAAALETLGNPADQSAPAVLAALYQRHRGAADAELRWTALELLVKHAPLDASGQAVVLEALDDGDEHVRSVAIAAVPKAGVPADRGVPALVRWLAGPHAVVTARALSDYRAAASAALPDLVRLMHDSSSSSEARWNAARTIGKIGPEALPALRDLIAELDSPDDTLREHAAEAIGDIGPTAAELGVPALRGVLRDPYVKVRRDAVRSLGYIGPAAAAAVDDILPLLNDTEAIVQTAARDALKKIAPHALPPP